MTTGDIAKEATLAVWAKESLSSNRQQNLFSISRILRGGHKHSNINKSQNVHHEMVGHAIALVLCSPDYKWIRKLSSRGFIINSKFSCIEIILLRNTNNGLLQAPYLPNLNVFSEWIKGFEKRHRFCSVASVEMP